MSHLTSGALATLIALSACSKPPQGSDPEAPTSATSDADPAPAPSVPAGEAPPPAEAAPASSEPVIATLFVRERLVDCQAEGARKCLQVREAESAEWRNFYASIDGFDYEESHAYELRVAMTPNANPPADGASLRYRLVEIVSKRKIEPPAAGK
jgi:hypothetical protein